ncbi:nucleotidyltransferase family protein [Pseudomonas sp. B21-023]|uniref:nucleotidyltransferase family protein n=1 Tax=unclassified Pseudomonas TaxID=196821 RepID=UPI001119287B|nr:MULTISPECIES: nucleotidyltransferase family protein [unclassified Pseudomonas]UVM14639.1 nucleotidyltransferase family protein [Pseudomonas sp. B21-023]
MKVVALVLAAGQGARFGADKRRALMADGRSLLQHSVERALAAFDEVRVVLRAGERAEDLGLPPACRVVHSPDAGLGMGHSLAAGAASLGDSEAQAVAILLGDMPWIRPATLAHLSQSVTATSIVVPVFLGDSGHPVLFGRSFWPELLCLAGDMGARSILQRHPEHVVHLEVSDPGVLQDVDTPATLRQLPS